MDNVSGSESLLIKEAFEAVSRCDLQTFQELVNRGFKLNSQNPFYSYNTPLHLAAKFGSLDIVKYLVEKGADVKATNNHGQTPLHLAAKYDYRVILEYLVEKGADVKATDKDGQTPLHLALWWKNRDVVDYLVGKGADVKVTGKDGQTPLHLALRCESDDVVKYLVEKRADVKATDKDWRTPLHVAAKDGRHDVVKYLVEKGAKVLATNWLGWTPLHLAAENGHLAIVDYLTEMERHVDTTAETDLTPLNAVSNQETDSSLQLCEHELSDEYSTLYLGDHPAPQENNAMQQGGSKPESTINSELDEEGSDGAAVPTKKPKKNEESIRPTILQVGVQQDWIIDFSSRLDAANNEEVQQPVSHDDPKKQGLHEHMADGEENGLPADGQADDPAGSSLAGAPCSSEVNGFQALLQKFEVESQEKLKAFADLVARAETAVRKLEAFAAGTCSCNRLQVAQQAHIVLNISEPPTSHIMAGSFPESSALPVTSINSHSDSMEQEFGQYQGPAEDVRTEQAPQCHPGTSRGASSTGTNEETPDLIKLETAVKEARGKKLPQFVAHLMTRVFSRRYLATHALSDGSSKFGKPIKVPRKPMHTKARDAIIDETLKEFPAANVYEIKAAIRKKFNNSTSKE